MDGTVDKEKFKAAVFRRGQKQELLHSSTGGGGKLEQDGSTIPDHVTGDEKIEELFKLWSLPRSGKDLAAAIWRPSKCAAHVVLQKGRLFSHVGCLWGGHVYLTIEEAVYMVDRGSMLLFHEDGKNKKLLTMKECYALMESCGVSMDHFITYCKMLRAGYVAHRRGLPWVLKSKAEIERHDCRFHETFCQQHVVEQTPHVTRAKKKMRIQGTERMAAWWPEYQWHAGHATLPTCVVVDEKQTKEHTRRKHFPRMVPLASYEPTQVTQGDSQGIYLEIYPANGTFSRKQAGNASSLLSMVACGQAYPPSSETLEDMGPLGSSASDPSVRFVGVEHGDIALYSFFRTTLRDIH